MISPHYSGLSDPLDPGAESYPTIRFLVVEDSVTRNVPSAVRNFDLLTWSVDTVTKWWQVIIIVAGWVMSSWAAWFTAALAPYSPLSWVLAGAVMALVLAVIITLLSKTADVLTRWNFARKMAASPPSFNPLDTVFERMQLKLSDLRNPYAPVHDGKTFLDCELIGPGVIAFYGSTVERVAFIGCDCVAIKKDAQVQNLLVLRNAVVRGGEIYGATILFSEADVPGFRTAMPNINWITQT